MNTATVICDNARAIGAGLTGNRLKGASEHTGDEPQQRFADVLPLAQAAMERTSDTDVADEAPVEDVSCDEETAAESLAGTDRPARRREKTAAEDAPPTGWPFQGVVQPSIPGLADAGSADGQTVAGQQTAEPTVSGGGNQTLEQILMAQGGGDAGPVPVQKPQSTQESQPAPAAEQPAIASTAATMASSLPASQGQNVASSPVTAGERIPTASQQMVQEAAADGVPTAPSEVQSESAAQAAAVSKVVKPASQVGARPDAPAPVKATTDRQDAVVPEKTEQIVANAQSANPRQAVVADVAAQTETDAPDQMPEVSVPEGRANIATKSTTAAHGESPKSGPARPTAASSEDFSSEPVQPTTASNGSSPGESAHSAAPDAVAHGVKDVGASTAEFRGASSGEPMAAAPRTTATTQTSVDASPVRNPAQSVGEQILDSIRSSGTPGEREVFIRLTPPELGTVLVRFQERGGQLTGTLEVSSREAQREIEQALPQVVRGLQEAGVLVRRVEVVTADQPNRDLAGEHQSQDTWQQQAGTGQGREHSPAASHNRWSQNLGRRGVLGQEASGGESQTAVAPGRIDLLL
jgi:flagellar hook-length control protein FliK